MHQRTLFDERTLQERFERFHARHPDVYALFKRLAFELRNAGRDHYGAKSIIEVIRFHRTVSSGGGAEPFKLNNSYTSRYVRMLVDECPEFKGFFEMRTLKTE